MIKIYTYISKQFLKPLVFISFAFGFIVMISEFFREIEYAPSVQVIAYEMAIINNIEVLEMSKRIPHVSTKYIQTHRG